ncbi:hypothetical protein DL96DRAFT_1210960 [Flagelloscypha sp. PMI_526]|nr:hypothetical protein DL96DRAFT_1210960 [Flagelloscypha sp. PMI_526]
MNCVKTSVLRKLSAPLESRSAWLNAVARRALLAAFIAAFYVVLAVPLIYRAYNAPSRGLKHPTSLLADDVEGIMIIGGVMELDFVQLQASIIWSVVGCGPTYCPSCGSSPRCGPLSETVNVFMDSNATKASLSTPNIDVSLATATLDPVFANDPTLWSLQDSSFKSRRVNTPTFTTQQPLDFAHRIWTRVTSGHAFPRDDYTTSSAFFISTNSNVTLPIRRVAVYSLTQDAWLVESNEYDVPRLRNANDSSAEFVFPNVRGVSTKLKRPSALITFVIGAVFAVNWCIALVVILLTVWVLLLRNPDPSKKNRVLSVETLLLVPITALFSMPQLRSVTDFSPIGSGADGSGFLPCLIIVAVCTALMLGYMVTHTAGHGFAQFLEDIYEKFLTKRGKNKNKKKGPPPPLGLDNEPQVLSPSNQVVDSPSVIDEEGFRSAGEKVQSPSRAARPRPQRHSSTGATVINSQSLSFYTKEDGGSGPPPVWD